MAVDLAGFNATGFQWLAAVVILWCSVGCKVAAGTHGKQFENIYAGIDLVPMESKRGFRKQANPPPRAQHALCLCMLIGLPCGFGVRGLLSLNVNL